MRSLICLLACLAAAPASAEIRSRADCLAAIEADPAQAREDAAAWVRTGGSVPARLCEATALRATGAIGSAALLLTELGQDPNAVMEPETRADILTEAGLLWLDLAAPEFARTTLRAADSLSPDRSATLLGLGRAELQLGDHAEAAAALDRLLALAPQTPEAHLLRAQARRELGDLAGARADLSLAPDSVETRLEDARLRLAEGDRQGAADLLLGLIAAAPDSPGARVARRLLQEMAL